MIRDITIGQYYKTESFLHRLDPRVKLLGTLLYFISIFLFSYPYGLLLSAAFLAVVICASRVPVRFMLRGLKPVFLLIIMTVLIKLFMTQGEVLVQVWIIKITKEGIAGACLLSARFILLIVSSSVMTFTTTPNELTSGIESLLGPLRIVKLPVHEMAMMMTIALRFIPILIEETDRIMKVQSARCADFESGNLVRRARNMLPLLVPLFVSAVRRADDLAMAMEARGYRGSEGRTRMKPLRYKGRDWMAYFILLLYYAAEIMMKVLLRN